MFDAMNTSHPQSSPVCKVDLVNADTLSELCALTSDQVWINFGIPIQKRRDQLFSRCKCRINCPILSSSFAILFRHSYWTESRQAFRGQKVGFKSLFCIEGNVSIPFSLNEFARLFFILRDDERANAALQYSFWQELGRRQLGVKATCESYCVTVTQSFNASPLIHREKALPRRQYMDVRGPFTSALGIWSQSLPDWWFVSGVQTYLHHVHCVHICSILKGKSFFKPNK